MKRLLTLFFLLAPSAALAQPSVLIRSEISPKEIFIGDSVQMRITVLFSTAIAPAPVEFPKNLGEFEVLTVDSSAPKPEKKDRMAMTHTLTLTTFSTGTVSIAAVPLYFRGAGGALSEARTDEVPVTVKSLLAEKGDEGSLRPLKGLFSVRSLWPLWALLGALALGALAWAVARMRKGTAAATPGREEPAMSPEDEANAAIETLLGGPHLAEGQFKEFYSGLSSIFRRYVERRFLVAAPEMTSSELLAALRKADVPTGPAQEARAFLDNADLVKFAKWTPELPEVTTDVDRVKAFVSATTVRPVEPEPESAPPPEEAIPL